MKSSIIRKKLYMFFLASMLSMCSISINVFAEDVEISEDGPSMEDEDSSVEESKEKVTEESTNKEGEIESSIESDVVEAIETPQEAEEQPVQNNTAYQIEEVPTPQSELIEKRWNIGPEQARSITCKYTIPANTTRFEVFYNKNALAPEITFQTTSGFLYKTSQDVYTDPVTGARYETRRGNQVNDYSDMAYMVIYITKPSDPGMWHITVDLDDDTHTFLMVKTEIPEDFLSLVKEYKMYVTDTVLWAIDSTKTECKLSDLVDMASAEPRPEENDVKNTEPDQEVHTDPLVYIIILLVIMIIGFTVFIFFNINNSNKTKEEITKKKVNNANKKFKKKKSKENDVLDELMSQYDDEYTDDYIETDETTISSTVNNEEFNESEVIDENIKPNKEEKVQYIKSVNYTGEDRRQRNKNYQEKEQEIKAPVYNQNEVQEEIENIELKQNSVKQISQEEVKAEKNENSLDYSHIETSKIQNISANEVVNAKEMPSWIPKEEKKTPKWMEEDDDDNFF